MKGKKYQLDEIQDERTRRITFKKRRIGILNKAIQLSMLTGSQIEMKIYNPRDNSLVEYYSNREGELTGLSKQSDNILEFAKFFNCHANMLLEIDERVTKHGNTVGNTKQPNKLDDEFHKSLIRQLDNKNLMSLFSLAKQKII